MPALSSEAQSPSPPATVTPVSSMSGAGATSQQSFMPAQPRRFLNRSSCATLSPTASLLAGAGLLASSPGSPSAASSAAYAHKLALKDVMPVSLAAPLVSQSNLAPSWTSPQPSPPGQQQAPGPRPLLHAPALLLRSLSSRLRMQVHPSPSPSPSHSQAAQQARAGELGAQRGSAPGVSPTTALDRSVRESTPPDCPLPRGMVGSEPVPPSGSAASMRRRLTARTLSLPRLLPERLVRRQRTMPDETETSDEGRAVHTPGSGTGRAMLLSSGLQGGATDPGPSSGRSLRHAVSLKALLHLDSYEFFPDVAVAASTDGEDRGSPAPGSPLASTGGCTARRDTCEYSGPLSMGTMSGNGCSSGNASVLPRFPSRQRSSMLEPTRSSSPPPLPHQAQEEAAVLPAGAVLLAVASTLPPAMRRPAWSQRDFTFTKHLHTGYASEVYMARCSLSGQEVVLKAYTLSKMDDLQRVQLYREVQLHSRLEHPNVVQLYAAFMEDGCVVLVQEALCGDLLRFMYRKYGGRLPERVAVSLVLLPLLSALSHLHSEGIVHRDIKPENLLISTNDVVKLGDFGLAVDLSAERANTRAGTLDYMAPEVLFCPVKKTPDAYKTDPGARHYNVSADIWAVGVLAYELLVGQPPFRSKDMQSTAMAIVHGEVDLPSGISEGARNFITRTLSKHHGDRPTVRELLRHPWIRMAMNSGSAPVYVALLSPSPPNTPSNPAVVIAPQLDQPMPASPSAAGQALRPSSSVPCPPSAPSPLASSPSRRRASVLVTPQ